MNAKWIYFFRKYSNKGYISIEVVIVTGLILSLGAFGIGSLNQSTEEINEVSMNSINENLSHEALAFHVDKET